MSGFAAAVNFLTRFPMPAGPPGDLSRAVPWFPIVGALIGATMTGVYALGYRFLPSLLVAVVAVVVGIVVTGALHEDGLADSFDAIGSGATGEEGLAIMRDSRLGTYGTTALVASILWRVIALGSLEPELALVALVSAHSLARAGAVALMAITNPARADGLGRSGVVAVTARGAWVAAATGMAVFAFLGGWWALPGIALVTATVLCFRYIGRSRFGGVTGDLLGACEQIGEVTVLTLVAGAAWLGGTPWWGA
ncbi:MAG TPA: adenosylcobinamide-GDP ribazoletransferase [Acidimicrobiia bacterium]|nr:adenosylcobinamide-GDP ribazoletransferase [Acidimicrobiia bacterium]